MNETRPSNETRSSASRPGNGHGGNGHDPDHDGGNGRGRGNGHGDGGNGHGDGGNGHGDGDGARPRDPERAPATARPLIDARGLCKYFGNIIALEDVSLSVRAGEVMCLLGDNGAGKSTLIKILSGVHEHDRGQYLVEGQEVRFRSPREALSLGIATVYQNLAMVPLMSIARNFFLGSEPLKGRWPFRRFDLERAATIARKEIGEMGIDVRDTTQPVGTLSGGERQCVAIARAVHFGARVLILDEPTSALGVKEASVVIRYVARARARGLAVVFITHNPAHAYAIGDRFTVLDRGRCLGTFEKRDIEPQRLVTLMAGGQELAALETEIAAFSDGVAATDPGYMSNY